jgi:hypothetical protein
LAERIAQNAAKPSDKREDPAKIVVSLTDPIAPLGRDKLKVYRPLYTIQYVVEPTSHLIMSYCCDAAARGQTVERGSADAKGNRRLDRFHGRALRRARTETGLLVLAQNLLRLDRLQQESLNYDETAT